MFTSNVFARGVQRASPSTYRAATASRAFSDKTHRPVIHLNGLAARYANATYVAASKGGLLDKVEQQLLALAKSAEQSPKFAQFLENPLISRADKIKAVESFDKLAPVTKNLLVTLAGNARLAELPKVASTFAQLMKAKRGEVDAKIISAEPLPKAVLKDIQDAMKSQVPAGQTVILETLTDPSIVGGLQVQIGDKFLDLSVKSRVEEISRMAV